MTDQDNNLQQQDNAYQPAEGEERSRKLKAGEAAEDADHIHLTSDSTLQTPEEYHLDKETPHKDELIISSTDDHTSNSDGLAGTDRAGTAERKDYGPGKLNQGIEEQGGQKTYD